MLRDLAPTRKEPPLSIDLRLDCRIRYDCDTIPVQTYRVGERLADDRIAGSGVDPKGFPTIQ
jgi:hypothetical protein